MLRRLHHDQPESFAFTAANHEWAEAQVTKYPEGRQASAIIPLLWRAQEQEGWLTRPAIEHVADMLGMSYIRALEVATFYFMFQLQPVGSVAHVQVCGTTSCMIMGAEGLMGVCQKKIGRMHELSGDGKFSWEEVECLGACANAPMAQIGKDYYEDLTEARLEEILDEMAAGKVPVPGPQTGRFASEPEGGLTSLEEYRTEGYEHNASVRLALDIGDTLKRIDGTEVPLKAPWRDLSHVPDGKERGPEADPRPSKGKPVDETGATEQAAQETEKAHPDADVENGKSTTPAASKAEADAEAAQTTPGTKPAMLTEPHEGGPDDLKHIKGVGPKLEKLMNSMGIYHFSQIAGWTDDEVEWVDENLVGFKGRVSRDGWVAQARTLAAGEETEFSSRAKKGDVD